MKHSCDPFEESIDSAPVGITFKSDFYIPFNEAKMQEKVFVVERNVKAVYGYEFDNKHDSKFTRVLIFRREYFYYNQMIPARLLIKKALFSSYGKHSIAESKLMGFIFTSDLKEINRVYNNRLSDLILFKSRREAVGQYKRLISIIEWLKTKVPMYLQKNGKWSQLGELILEYVMNVEISLDTLQSNFQSAVKK